MRAFSAGLTAVRHSGSLYGLIVLCTVIELYLMTADTGLLTQPRLRQTVYEYGGFWPGLLGPWTANYTAQPYVMFLSYALLHGGIMHLVFNMITLFSLGPMVITRVGQMGFNLVFWGAVVGGALGYGLLSNTPTPMVGASGGLFGLIGALLSWNYIDRFIQERRLSPVLKAVLGLFLLNLVLWWLMDKHLAWETHLGGFFFGWIIALLVDPRSRAADTPEQ